MYDSYLTEVIMDESIIQELLGLPCYVIDLLPKQVKADSKGQFFSVESFFLQSSEYPVLRRKFRDILLKLNCYYDISVWDTSADTVTDFPAPQDIARIISANQHFLYFVISERRTLITVDSDDIYITVYSADEEIIGIIRCLSQAEGLFFRKSSGNKE